MLPTETPEPAADLVARIRRGDGEAERQLVERTGRGVRIILRKRLRGDPDADDLYQETFRLAFEKIRRGDLKDPSKVGPFVAGLARNLTIDRFRRRARRRTEPDSEAVERVAYEAPNPLDRLLREEKVDLVRRLLSELGQERDSQVLQRFYLEEEEKGTICEALGLTSLHFNRVLHRARQRYRTLYEEACGEEGSHG